MGRAPTLRPVPLEEVLDATEVAATLRRAATRGVPTSRASTVAQGRIAVAVPSSATPEASSVVAMATTSPTATNAAVATRLALLGSADLAEAATIALGPSLPVPAGATSARAGRTGVRLGLLPVPMGPATVPTLPLVPAVLKEGATVPKVGRARVTVPKEATSLRATLDAARGAPLVGRVRVEEVPVNGLLPVVATLLAGTLGPTRLPRLLEVARPDSSSRRSDSWFPSITTFRSTLRGGIGYTHAPAKNNRVRLSLTPTNFRWPGPSPDPLVRPHSPTPSMRPTMRKAGWSQPEDREARSARPFAGT